jgi:D-alanyl-D-alanine dipeptidase
MLDVATVRTFAGNGIQGAIDGQTQLSSFFNPTGISVDINGNIYVADTNNHRIRKISQGVTSTLAGSTSGFADGTGVISKFNSPQGVAIDLTLVDKNGKELEMGTYFDDFSARAHHNCQEISVEAQQNRLLLCGLMTICGWDFYSQEWWHYQLLNPRNYPIVEYDNMVSNQIRSASN